MTTAARPGRPHHNSRRSQSFAYDHLNRILSAGTSATSAILEGLYDARIEIAASARDDYSHPRATPETHHGLNGPRRSRGFLLQVDFCELRSLLFSA
jgi:hypothetical protein